MAATRIALQLAYTPPLDGAALLDHFARLERGPNFGNGRTARQVQDIFDLLVP